jgi:hypothetical protein
MIFFAEMGSLRHCDGCGEKKLAIWSIFGLDMAV